MPLAVDRHPKADDLKRGNYFEGFAPGSDRRTLFSFDYKVKGKDGLTFYFVDAREPYSWDVPPASVAFSWRDVQLGLLLVRRT